jgi:hypothetical protein
MNMKFNSGSNAYNSNGNKLRVTALLLTIMLGLNVANVTGIEW